MPMLPFQEFPIMYIGKEENTSFFLMYLETDKDQKYRN
jgi:hypothetical protein